MKHKRYMICAQCLLLTKSLSSIVPNPYCLLDNLIFHFKTLDHSWRNQIDFFMTWVDTADRLQPRYYFSYKREQKRKWYTHTQLHSHTKSERDRTRETEWLIRMTSCHVLSTLFITSYCQIYFLLNLLIRFSVLGLTNIDREMDILPFLPVSFCLCLRGFCFCLFISAFYLLLKLSLYLLLKFLSSLCPFLDL